MADQDLFKDKPVGIEQVFELGVRVGLSDAKNTQVGSDG